MKRNIYLLSGLFCILILNAVQNLNASSLINRSILEANQQSQCGANNTLFFVHDQWMLTWQAANQLTFNSEEKLGVAEKLEIKDSVWVLDSVEFYMASKSTSYCPLPNGSCRENEYVRVKYVFPDLDSLQLVVWKGLPFAEGSFIVYGDPNYKADHPFEIIKRNIRFAKRTGGGENLPDYITACQDTSEIFSIKAKFPTLKLERGVYYLGFMLKSTNPHTDKKGADFYFAQALVYNGTGEAYTGNAVAIDPYWNNRGLVRSLSSTKGNLSLAMNLWGGIQGECTKDLLISDINVPLSCDMRNIPIEIKLKNIQTESVDISEGKLKIYYAIDSQLVTEGVYADGDTIEADFTISGASSLVSPGQEVVLTEIGPKNNSASGLNFRGLNQVSRFRVWIEAEEDLFEENNASSLRVRNPGSDIRSLRSPDKEIQYAIDFGSPSIGGISNPFQGLALAYPQSYTSDKGGWTLLDNSLNCKTNNTTIKTINGLTWKAPESGSDTQTDQWFFTDCLDFAQGVSYVFDMNMITYGSDFLADFILATDANPSTEVQKLATGLLIRSENDSLWTGGAYRTILTFTPQFSGVHRMGIRQASPLVSGGKRVPIVINAYKLVQHIPYRIEVTDVVLPVSSCNLTAQDSVKILVKNYGYQAFQDSMCVQLALTGPDGEKEMKEAFFKVDLKARMAGDDQAKSYTFPSSFDLSREGAYQFEVKILYREEGEYKELSLSPYVMADFGKVNSHYPHLTPMLRDFKKSEDFKNWKDVTLNSITNGEWSNERGFEKTGKDGEQGVLLAIGVGASTNAWYRSSCISMSPDSVYEMSVWVKYGGQGESKNNPSLDILFSQKDKIYNSSNTTRIRNRIIYTYGDWTQIKQEFSVPKSGSYYIAFNYLTKFDGISEVLVDDFSLRAVRSNEKDNIVLSLNDSQMGEVFGAGVYNRGEAVNIIARAKAGYKFSKWEESDTLVSSDSAYTFLSFGDRSLKAYFEKGYVVTVMANDTNLGDVFGGGVYAVGENVLVSARAKVQGRFGHWQNRQEVQVSTQVNYRFVMGESEQNLVAVFAPRIEGKYLVELKLNNSQWGNVEGTGEYAPGESVTIRAIPAKFAHFEQWEGIYDEFISDLSEYTFIMEDFDRTYTAVFAEGINVEIEQAYSSLKSYVRDGTLYLEGLPLVTDISIIDILGRTIAHTQSSEQCALKISREGIYIVRLRSNNNFYSFKIVVK